MSCSYKALPRIIGEIVISAPLSSEVCIVSPWIHNVDLIVPSIEFADSVDNTRVMSLEELICFGITELDLRFVIVMRETQRSMQLIFDRIQRIYQNSFSLTQQEHLHAKCIVTNYLVLLTSANLIPTSLYRNRETCQLLRNPYRTSRNYLKKELHIEL